MRQIFGTSWIGVVCLTAGFLASAGCGGDEDPHDDDNGNANGGDGGAPLAVLEEVRFNETDRFEIRNQGTAQLDLSTYWYCANRDYGQLSGLTVESGSLSLAPGESAVLSGFDFAEASDFGLYDSNAFADPTALVDYVRWGALNASNRESVAVAAGIWTGGDTVDVAAIEIGDSIEYDGGGDAASDWAIQSSPTLADPIGASTVPRVTASAYSARLTTMVEVDEAVSVGPGFIVIYEDDAGGIGGPIGWASIPDGLSTDVEVELQRRVVSGETLYAMLHTDDGVIGEYEFDGSNGLDGPVSDDEGVIAPSFVVTVPSDYVDLRLTFSGGVPSYTVTLFPSTYAGDLDGNQDPAITLRPNWRYEVENLSFVGHPWEIVDGANDELLSQVDAGSLEGDPDIDWQDDGSGTSAFTFDPDLLAAASAYRCSIHTGSMVGDITAP